MISCCGGGLWVARLLQLHAHQRLGRKQADFVEIDQAEIRLIQIQLFLLIDALVDGADDVLRFLQNSIMRAAVRALKSISSTSS